MEEMVEVPIRLFNKWLDACCKLNECEKHLEQCECLKEVEDNEEPEKVSI